MSAGAISWKTGTGNIPSAVLVLGKIVNIISKAHDYKWYQFVYIMP